MVFSIEFIEQGKLVNPDEVSESLDEVCLGRITIGTFSEKFESPLCFWREPQYKEQWIAAISRLLSSSEKTALITAMYDPVHANFLTCWPIYRENKMAYFQNQLLFLDQLTTPFNLASIDEHIKPRRTVDDKGRRISEWSIGLSDLVFWVGL